LLFITVHQAYELWFKQILHELDAAIVSLRRRSRARSDACVESASSRSKNCS
jgi:tryptophan 2,3-dioxygenase